MCQVHDWCAAQSLSAYRFCQPHSSVPACVEYMSAQVCSNFIQGSIGQNSRQPQNFVLARYYGAPPFQPPLLKPTSTSWYLCFPLFMWSHYYLWHFGSSAASLASLHNTRGLSPLHNQHFHKNDNGNNHYCLPISSKLRLLIIPGGKTPLDKYHPTYWSYWTRHPIYLTCILSVLYL
jgi:hypothetical protein